MNDIYNQLEAFVDYFENNRQVGHTTAMMEGVKKVDAVVVTHSCDFSNYVSNPNSFKTTPRGRPIVLRSRECGSRIKTISIQENLEKLKGMRTPLIFDNGALYVLFRAASDEIGKLEVENAKLKQKINRALADLS